MFALRSLSAALPHARARNGTARPQPLGEAPHPKPAGGSALDAYDGVHLETAPEGLADRAYDGLLLGPEGEAYLPGTPLELVPPSAPKDGKRRGDEVLLINGMMTPRPRAMRTAHYISNRTGYDVVCLHNASQGNVRDKLELYKDYFQLGRPHPAVAALAEILYQKAKSGESLHLMVHSQGGCILAWAMKLAIRRLVKEDGLTSEEAGEKFAAMRLESLASFGRRYPPTQMQIVSHFDPRDNRTWLGVGGPLRALSPNEVIHNFDGSDWAAQGENLHSMRTLIGHWAPFEELYGPSP